MNPSWTVVGETIIGVPTLKAEKPPLLLPLSPNDQALAWALPVWPMTNIPSVNPHLWTSTLPNTAPELGNIFVPRKLYSDKYPKSTPQFQKAGFSVSSTTFFTDFDSSAKLMPGSVFVAEFGT